MVTITIDMRMLNASGIGVYLRNLIPLVIAACPEQRFVLLGNASNLSTLIANTAGHVDIIPCTAAIYSITEQIQLAKRIPQDTSLLWAPHYNIPVFYRGNLLVTVHDVLHLARPDLFPGWRRRFYAQLMFRRVALQASEILCDSIFTQDELRRYVSPHLKNITVVPLGVSPAWFKPVTPESPPHPRPYLFFVGNIKPHKNLLGLLRAFSLIQDRIPHDLVIVGRSAGFKTSDEAALKLAKGMSRRVHLLGDIEDALVQRYMAHAQMLVLPSLYEGFGLPALEAMASACPVLAANIPALVEVCADAALYCDPLMPNDIAEQILKLISDSALSESLIKKGALRAQAYSWQKSAQQTTALIKRMIH